MKGAKSNRFPKIFMSSLVRGKWIERIAAAENYAEAVSSLVRGKWIERFQAVSGALARLSSLVRGKWIERLRLELKRQK